MRVLGVSAVVALAASSSAHLVGDLISLEKWIAKETPIAKANLLANIGPNGSRAPGAFPGVVVASPSTVNPDYYYSWIRDSSLVFKYIIDTFTQGKDNSLRALIDDFVLAQANLQGVANPSGGVESGNNLGEPKFYVNETAFLGNWGRPQRDGPALRSTALITYANWLLSHGNQTFVTTTIWPIVQKDLNYVALNWNQSSYDLWEEENTSSFFTSAVQHRALREGISLAKTLSKSVPTWSTQSDNVLCFLQTYWNATGSYIHANVGQRSGLDANTVLASIHTFDPTAGCDSTTFQPCSDKALANLHAYVESFRTVYPINHNISAGQPISVGRYPEDVYYNGNPWYLALFAVSEQLSDALYVWAQQKSITVTSTSLGFFQTFVPHITPGTYSLTTPTYITLMAKIALYANGFLELNQVHTPADGSLSEQYDKVTGVPTSAVHLTWSYAAALTAFGAHGLSLTPASWGAKGLKVSSGACQVGPAPPTIPVSFNVDATTVSGELIYIVGSVPALENWNPQAALVMNCTGTYPTWRLTVALPIDENVQYKYIRMSPPDTTVTWESDLNNALYIPVNGTLSTNDTWR